MQLEESAEDWTNAAASVRRTECWSLPDQASIRYHEALKRLRDLHQSGKTSRSEKTKHINPDDAARCPWLMYSSPNPIPELGWQILFDLNIEMKTDAEGLKARFDQKFNDPKQARMRHLKEIFAGQVQAAGIPLLPQPGLNGDTI